MSYGVRPLAGAEPGFIGHITSWGGQRCRLTTVKATEDEAVRACERWIDRALAERVNPDAPTYRWVADPEALTPGGFVCARITGAGPEPVLE